MIRSVTGVIPGRQVSGGPTGPMWEEAAPNAPGAPL